MSGAGKKPPAASSSRYSAAEPNAERLTGAVEAGDPSPDAFGALGRICQDRDMLEDAEAFLVEARRRDRLSELHESISVLAKA